MPLLNCAIIGVRGVISVIIEEWKTVALLKDVIKAKNPRKIACPANKLQLFLAKMEDGKWLSSSTEDVKKLKEGEKTSLVAALMHENQELQREDSIVHLLAGMETPKARQIHVLVVIPNERKRRRLADADASDAWMKAIKNEQVTVLPSTCEDLREYLQRPLRIKIPIYERYFYFLSAYNTTGKGIRASYKLFEPEPRVQVDDGTMNIVGSVIDSLDFSAKFETEESYHYLWDNLIALMLRRVVNGRYCRNKNVATSIGPSRPDLCFYCDNSNVCVFRGEEKARGALEMSITELHRNLAWTYDPAPYIYGYVAVGLQVCLVLIRKNERMKCSAKVETIETYDLSKLSSRLVFFLALLNLSTLFRPVVKLIQPLTMPGTALSKRQ